MPFSSLPIFGAMPKEGARYISANFNFAATALTTLTQTFNLTDCGMSQIRGLLMDNSLSARGAYITIQDTGQSMQCRPAAQLRDEVFTGGLSITITVSSTGGVNIPIKLFNIPLKYYHEFSFNPNATQYVSANTVVTAVSPTVAEIIPPNPKRQALSFTISTGTTTANYALIYTRTANDSGYNSGPAFVIPFGGAFPFVNTLTIPPSSEVQNMLTCGFGCLLSLAASTATMVASETTN